MNFLELNADVTDLRKSLRSSVRQDALAEITVRPPVGHCDEASFLRLVAWAYALLYEADRVTIPYLLRLPDEALDTQPSPRESRHIVGYLRTWVSHNLGLAAHDMTVSRKAMHWIRVVCGTDSPKSASEWQDCFYGLCDEVGTVVTYCKRVVDAVLLSASDGEDCVADLRRRINRHWPPYEFDKIVGDICLRFGQQLEVSKFREPRLSAWVNYLETLPEDVDLHDYVVRRIERDVLDYCNNILPIDGRDVMAFLGIGPGPEVQKCLNYARSIFNSTTHSQDSLLESVQEWYYADHSADAQPFS